MKVRNNIERKRGGVKKQHPNIVQSGMANSIRGKVAVAALVALGGVVAYSGLRPESTENKQSVDTEKASTNTLFAPVSIDRTISKGQVPVVLAKKLSNLGELIKSPETFDSNKPNLYLIANQHLAGEETSPELEPLIYETQENILKIYHVLYSLGTEVQFIEGQPVGYQLEHDKPDPRVGDHPYNVLDKYKRTGKIGYVSSAIEGVYGSKVYSVGIDNPEKYIEVVQNNQEAIQRHWSSAQSEIYPAISKELGISDLPQTSKEIEAHIQRMRAASTKLTEQQRKDMTDKYLLGNAHYRALLEATTEFAYYRIAGRNKLFAEIINESAAAQKDSTFIVGMAHLYGLMDQIKGWNVFIIQPCSVKDFSLDGKKAYVRLQTKEAFRAHILEHGQFMFGLSNKDNE
ncbi:hypothetical protein IT411_00145 [Candidatus Peregrinibacteria bacterium]|nr:hypothetical protein [Candidatus Peregrinibacteria bacterium]